MFMNICFKGFGDLLDKLIILCLILKNILIVIRYFIDEVGIKIEEMFNIFVRKFLCC